MLIYPYERTRFFYNVFVGTNEYSPASATDEQIASKAWSSDYDVKLFGYSAIIERAFVEKWDVKYPYISRSWKNN